MRNHISWHLRDVLVGALCLSFIGAMGLGDLFRSRETNNRIKCASNLRQIGQAILLYAFDNKGAYPRTVCSADQDPKPVWGTPYEGDKELGAVNETDPEKTVDAFASDKSPVAKYRPAPNDVTAAMFLLLRTEDITSDVFICPSSKLPHFDFGGGKNTALSWTNWPGNDSLAKHLSYSYQNPYCSPASIEAGFKLNSSIAPDFAVASDMNPGGDAVVNAALTTPADGMRKANTLNHNQDGQNVLYGDGHVEFQNNPFCGSQRDNIYTANGPEIQGEKERTGKAAVSASPAGPSDSILLPTAADIGFKGP